MGQLQTEQSEQRQAMAVHTRTKAQVRVYRAVQTVVVGTLQPLSGREPESAARPTLPFDERDTCWHGMI